MTPRRYLASTLTVDNRDHSTHSDTMQDEIRALRNAYRLVMERERVKDLRIDALEKQNAELEEMVCKKDELLAAFNDGDSTE